MLELQSHLSNLDNQTREGNRFSFPLEVPVHSRVAKRPLKDQCFGASHGHPLLVASHSWVLTHTQANLSSRMVILEQNHPWALPVSWGSWLASVTALVIASRRCSCSQRSQPDTALFANRPSLSATFGGCFLPVIFVAGSSCWPGLLLVALLIALS